MMHQIRSMDALACHVEQLGRELKKAVITTLEYSSEMHIMNHHASEIQSGVKNDQRLNGASQNAQNDLKGVKQPAIRWSFPPSNPQPPARQLQLFTSLRHH
jgi:hypothetical protein